MSLRFEQPEWLALLALAAPVLVLGLRWLVGLSPTRRFTAVATRLILIGLITGMLAGATAVRKTERLAVIAVIDMSGSIQRLASFGADEQGRPRRAAEVVRNWLEHAMRVSSRLPDDLLGIVVFDGAAVAVATPGPGDVLAGRSIDLSMAEGTNIADALRLAAAMFPPDATRRIVLFSDGNETAGRAADAARELASGGGAARSSPGGETVRTPLAVAGVPIDVVPLAYNVAREVVVESVDAPPQAPPESTINVRVVLRATGPARGTLRLFREGEPVDLNGEAPGSGREVAVREGRSVEVLPVRLDRSRVNRFQAIFEPEMETSAAGAPVPAGDTILTNNSGEAFTLSPGRGSVLILDGVSGGAESGGGAVLGRTLADAGISVKTIPPEGLPTDLLSMQAYDLVILQNVPADALPRSAQDMLAAYVSDAGGGLVMVGGPSSFGAGGWKGTPIEPLLPVKLDLPERLVMPSAAIVLVLDNSGSMGRSVMGSTRSQQDIANEGAAMAVQSLDKTDLVGVIQFSSFHEVLVPLGPNKDPAATANVIRAISPNGGTNIPPAVEAAYEQLKGAKAQVRHVILLTDGISQDKEQLPELAARMARDGIKLSTIAVGDQADSQTLSAMATRGGGTFYRVTDPDLLPRIFIKAIRVVRTPLIREIPFDPVVLSGSSPILEGVGGTGTVLPTLGGLALTQPLNDATVTLAAVAPTGEPLLAHWNAGLGHVAAFTSDAHKWAAGWLDWPGYRRMWTQLVRQVARPASDRRAELTTQIVGDQVRLRLEAADAEGRPEDLLSVPAKVYSPSGRVSELRLTQTGPGIYEATAPAPDTGTYVAMASPRRSDGPGGLVPVVSGVSRATGVEYRELRSNVGLLREVSTITGGRLLDLADPDHANLFDRSTVRPIEARLPLWRTLLIWAVVVLLLDVGTRRIAWDRYFSKAYGADLRREAAEALADRGQAAAKTVGRLRGRIAVTSREPGGAVLGEEDARRVIQEQAALRKAHRRAAAQSGTQTPDTRGRATAKPQESQPDAADGAGAAGLLAAKRRARERFDEQERSDKPDVGGAP